MPGKDPCVLHPPEILLYYQNRGHAQEEIIDPGTEHKILIQQYQRQSKQYYQQGQHIYLPKVFEPGS